MSGPHGYFRLRSAKSGENKLTPGRVNFHDLPTHTSVIIHCVRVSRTTEFFCTQIPAKLYHLEMPPTAAIRHFQEETRYPQMLRAEGDVHFNGVEDMLALFGWPRQ